MARFCPNCGSEVNEGVSFCPNCGSYIGGNNNMNGDTNRAYNNAYNNNNNNGYNNYNNQNYVDNSLSSNRLIYFLLTFFLGFIGSFIINHSSFKPRGWKCRTCAYFFLSIITFGIYGLVASICCFAFDPNKGSNIGFFRD